MNSKDAQKLYSGYLEGELSADEEDELRSFFAASPEATDDYRAFEATVELLHALPKEEATNDMTLEIMSRVRRARTRGEAVVTGTERRRIRQLVPLAAMLVLGFVFAFAAINAGGGFGSAGDVTGGTSTTEQPEAFAAGTDVVPEGHALSETFEQNRYDRPLRQVDSGTESPSIVF